MGLLSRKYSEISSFFSIRVALRQAGNLSLHGRNANMRGLTVHIEDVQPSAADECAGAAGRRPGPSALGAGEGTTRIAPVSEPACSENEHRSGQLVEHYR